MTRDDIKAMLAKSKDMTEDVEIEYVENDEQVLSGRVTIILVANLNRT